MNKTSVILLVHGSRGEKEPAQRLKEIVQRLQNRLGDKVPVSGAALQFNHPNLEEAIEDAISSEANKLIILPYFLFDGTHINVDIPEKLNQIKQRHPGVEITMANTLGVDERLIDILAARYAEAVGCEPPATERRRLCPQEIEIESMSIIERLVSLDAWNEAERDVVKRLIHASGDPSLASYIRISPGAVESGIEAINQNCKIFTDVQMVAAGITANAAKAGCIVRCLVDAPEVADKARETGETRSATAIRHFAKDLDGAIVAIGNAPTALYALLDLIDEEIAQPALIAGLPVGFVGAAESKAELASRDLPYITVCGTRGGSPLAAAAVNALLKRSGK